MSTQRIKTLSDYNINQGGFFYNCMVTNLKATYFYFLNPVNMNNFLLNCASFKYKYDSLIKKFDAFDIQTVHPFMYDILNVKLNLYMDYFDYLEKFGISHSINKGQEMETEKILQYLLKKQSVFFVSVDCFDMLEKDEFYNKKHAFHMLLLLDFVDGKFIVYDDGVLRGYHPSTLINMYNSNLIHNKENANIIELSFRENNAHQLDNKEIFKHFFQNCPQYNYNVSSNNQSLYNLIEDLDQCNKIDADYQLFFIRSFLRSMNTMVYLKQAESLVWNIFDNDLGLANKDLSNCFENIRNIILRELCLFDSSRKFDSILFDKLYFCMKEIMAKSYTCNSRYEEVFLEAEKFGKTSI